MRFGLFVGGQWLAEEKMPQKIQDAVEQVRAARDAGFDLIATGQHYLSYPYQMPTPLTYLARLSAEAEGMQVAAAVLLLPLLQPVDIAESVATLDAMTGGRFVLGVGLGYREEEYTAFGIKASERVARTMEFLHVLKLLWGEPEVEFDGRFYTLPKIKPATRPVQQPHPPIWIAANNDRAIKRAARLGYPWLINPHATVSVLERQRGLYRESFQGSDVVEPSDVPMMRELYMDMDRERAIELARPYLGPKYQAYAAWGQDKALPGKESFAVPFEQLAQDRFLLGTPQDIIREVERYRDQLGVNLMLFRMQWPGMPQAQVMHQIALFRDHIIPHFRG